MIWLFCRICSTYLSEWSCANGPEITRPFLTKARLLVHIAKAENFVVLSWAAEGMMGSVTALSDKVVVLLPGGQVSLSPCRWCIEADDIIYIKSCWFVVLFKPVLDFRVLSWLIPACASVPYFLFVILYCIWTLYMCKKLLCFFQKLIKCWVLCCKVRLLQTLET